VRQVSLERGYTLGVLPHVILPHQTIYEQNPVPPRTWGERLGFGWLALVRGVATFGGKLAGISGFVGGSVLTYLVFVADLALPWAILAFAVTVLIVFVIGAYQLWSAADDAAWRFSPTWELCQVRADGLRALTEEYRYDGMGQLLDPNDVPHGQQVAFRRQYLAGHMAATKADFDRAVAAGYAPDFDRDKLGSADLPDVVRLADALQEVATTWRADAESGKWRGRPTGA
jgi:hypothetical protein